MCKKIFIITFISILLISCEEEKQINFIGKTKEEILLFCSTQKTSKKYYLITNQEIYNDYIKNKDQSKQYSINKKTISVPAFEVSYKKLGKRVIFRKKYRNLKEANNNKWLMNSNTWHVFFRKIFGGEKYYVLNFKNNIVITQKESYYKDFCNRSRL